MEDVAPAIQYTNKGVKIGANNVKQSLPIQITEHYHFARNVITLEAVPPGHAPNKMNPIPISGGN